MRFLTYNELRQMGIAPSRQHLRRLIAKGAFPKPYRLGIGDKGRMCWLEDEIIEFVSRKAAERELPRVRPADRADGGNIIPMRRGRRRSSAGEAGRESEQLFASPVAEPPVRPRFTADVGPRLVLRRPTS